jgi:hypothetical protein
MSASAVRSVLPVLLLSAAVTGCQPARSTDRESLARCLPNWVKLSQVERRLSELGAYAQGGKVFAGSGKEIYFYEFRFGGPPPGPYGGPASPSVGRTSDGRKWEITDLPKLGEQYALVEITVNLP